MINNPVLSSSPKRGATEKEATNQSARLKKIFTLIVNLQVNFLYQGLIKFTTVVIMVDRATKIKNVLVINFYVKNLNI